MPLISTPSLGRKEQDLSERGQERGGIDSYYYSEAGGTKSSGSLRESNKGFVGAEPRRGRRAAGVDWRHQRLDDEKRLWDSERRKELEGEKTPRSSL